MTAITPTVARRSHRTAIWCIVAFNVADVAFTKLALDRGATEGNPVSAWLLAHQLLWPTKTAVVILFTLIALSGRDARPVEVSRAWFVAGIYACVVLVNALTLARYV